MSLKTDIKDTRYLTYRKDKFELEADVTKEINFLSTAPNHFIINSSINDVVYVSDTPNVGINDYSKKLSGVSRQLYAELNGIRTLYLWSAGAGRVVIESYYTEFTEASVQPTLETIGENDIGSPQSGNYSLVGGVEQTVKGGPGWVIAFGAGVSPYTYVKNGSTSVWIGDYISSQPFWCDTSIKIGCPVNNAYVSIVYI